MLRFCLMLLIVAAVCHANAVNIDTESEHELEKKISRQEEKRDEENLQKLDSLLALKELYPLHGLKLQSRDAEDDLENMTPDEIAAMEAEDIFGDDGSEPLKELFEHIYKEWEKLILLQDVDAIVNKYTEDCIHIYRRNGKTQILTGRDQLKKAYKEWFDEYSIHSLEVEPIKEGRLGSEFLYLVDHIQLFDESKNKVGAITDLVIFKHIPHDDGKGGFEVQLVSEIHD